MIRQTRNERSWCAIGALFLIAVVSGCSTVYYGAMEKVGVHKRDILVSRVENARDAQTNAQEEFKSALEQFGAVVKLKETDLKKAYEKMAASYEDSTSAAQEVTDRIDKVESVAEDLFEEWEKELELYKNPELRRASKKKREDTITRYRGMLTVMKKAEKSMQPVLNTFQDNVLFLKHNLNAQAIGSLRSEFSALEGKIDGLIRKMNDAIASSNSFIEGLKQ